MSDTPTVLSRTHLPGFTHPVYLPFRAGELRIDLLLEKAEYVPVKDAWGHPQRVWDQLLSSTWTLDVTPYYALNDDLFTPMEKISVNLLAISAVGEEFEVEPAGEDWQKGMLKRAGS